MRMICRAVALGLFISMAQGLPVALPPPAAAEEEASLAPFANAMGALQAIYAEAGTLLTETGALDTRISALHYDGIEDAAIDADLTGFIERLATFNEAAALRFDDLRDGTDKLPTERERGVVTNALGVGDVLLVTLAETPEYLTDLLAATRAGDNAAFDRLSQRAMMRTSALLRTEAMMMRMQRESVRPAHPSHSLLSSVSVSNEAMAIFTDTAAAIFAGEDGEVDKAADAMRAKVKTMRGFIAEGEKKRKAMSLRLFLPSFTNPALATMREIMETEFLESLAIETEFADHLDDLADGLAAIYEGNVSAMEALDARTEDLVNQRIEVRLVIFEKMKKFAADL